MKQVDMSCANENVVISEIFNNNFFLSEKYNNFERINFCGLNQLGLFVEPSFPVFSQNLPNLRKLIPLRYIGFLIFQIHVSSTC